MTTYERLSIMMTHLDELRALSHDFPIVHLQQMEILDKIDSIEHSLSTYSHLMLIPGREENGKEK